METPKPLMENIPEQTMPRPVEDRRKEPRSSEDRREQRRFSIYIKYNLFLDGSVYKGLIGNLSLGGAYLSTIEPLITEDKLFQDGEIELRVSEKPIRVCCHIRYVGTGQSEYPAGVGIAFSDDNENARAAIKEFIINLFT